MIEDGHCSSKVGISRRLFLASTVGTAASASLLPKAFAQGTTESPRILKYSDHEPLGGMRTRFLKDVLFPTIERESNGRLRIEAHWDGEIASSYDALSTAGTGSATDMTVAVPEYFSDRLPLQQLFKSFPLGPAGERQVEFFRRAYAEMPELGSELESNNVISVFLATGYPVAFFGTRPLDGLGNIRGGRWRTASFWHRDFVRNAGATPVSMPWGQGVYDALRANALDGLMVNVDSGFMLNVHDVAPNVLVSKDLWLGHVYPVVMNKPTWDGLPQQDKDAIRRATSLAYETLGSVMDRSFDAQLGELTKAGATVRVLDPSETKQWEIVTKYRWVEDQRSKGVAGVDLALAKLASIMNDVMG